MADDSTPDPLGGVGGSYDPNAALFSLLGGKGMAQNPQLAMLQPQLQYAQALMGQGMATTPVASPWAAVARAVQGGLGGWEMGQYRQQAMDVLSRQQEEARSLLGAPVPGLDSSNSTAPVGAGNPATAPAKFTDIVDRASKSSGIPKPVLVGMITHESGWDPNAVNAQSGATGLTQVLASTAHDPGYGVTPISDADLKDPEKNVTFGANYLAARGRAIFGAKWDPNNLDMMKQALHAYGDGTASYADQVLAKSGLAPPGAAMVASNPQLNIPAGYMGAQELLKRAAIAASSGNPFMQQIAPYLRDQANMVLNQGRFSTHKDDRGNDVTVDNVSGQQHVTDPMPEGIFNQRQMAGIATAYQQRGIAGLSQEQQNLLNGQIAEHYIPSYDEKLGTVWKVEPPQWVKDYYANTQGAKTPGAQPAAAPAAAPGGAATPSTAAVPPPPAATGAEVQAQIDRGNTAYKADSDRATAFNNAAITQSDQTMAATQNIRALLASGKVAPGFFAPIMTEVAKAMKGADIDPNVVRSVTGMDPAAQEEMIKFLFQLSSTRAHENSANEGSQVLAAFMQNNPNWQSRPETIEALTRTLDMQAQYDKDRSQAMLDWIDQHQSNVRGYQRIGTTAFNQWFAQKYGSAREYAAAGMAASPAALATDAQGNQVRTPVPAKQWTTGLNMQDPEVGKRIEQHLRQLYPGIRVAWPKGNAETYLTLGSQ